MKILTSLNSPMRIDSYVLPDTGGQIGMTICPGKTRPKALSKYNLNNTNISL